MLSTWTKPQTTNTHRNHFLVANCTTRSTLAYVSVCAVADDAQPHLQRTGAPARRFLLCAGAEGSRAAPSRDGGEKSSEGKKKVMISLRACIFWRESGNGSKAWESKESCSGTVKGPGCKNQSDNHDYKTARESRVSVSLCRTLVMLRRRDDGNHTSSHLLSDYTHTHTLSHNYIISSQLLALMGKQSDEAGH